MEQGAARGLLPQLSCQGPLWKGCEGRPRRVSCRAQGCSSDLSGAGVMRLLSACPHPHCTGAQGNPGALTAPLWMTEHPGPHLQRCMLPQEPLSTTKWLGGRGIFPFL